MSQDLEDGWATDSLDDPDMALAADMWQCRHCRRRFGAPHSEEECLVREVMES